MSGSGGLCHQSEYVKFWEGKYKKGHEGIQENERKDPVMVEFNVWIAPLTN